MANRWLSDLHVSRSICLLLLILASPALSSKVGPAPPPTADPFADPKHDPNNPLKYIASNVLTGIAFTLILLVGITQACFVKIWGAKWMLSMVIGLYTFALGIGMRFSLHVKPDSQNLYIIEYMFVILSPCAFIAANYVLLGRLTRHLGCDKYLLVSPRRITITFISSDITTFLIQAAGGGLAASAHTDANARKGSHIFLIGLAIQLVSFFTFTCIYLTFLYRVRTRRVDVWFRDQAKPWYRDWRALAGALLLSCIGILIRSVYRCIELSQGFEGHLATIEACFYGLDTLPLFIAVSVYVPFWPGRFIPRNAALVEERPDSTDTVETEEKMTP